MNREEFLVSLERHLRHLPREERQEALDYYREYIEDAGPVGEEEVIRSLGEPKEVAEQVIQEAAWKAVETPAEDQRRRNLLKTMWIVLLSIMAGPIAVPLAISAVAVAVALLAAVLAALFSVVLAGAASVLAGAGLFVFGIPVLFSSVPSGLIVVGEGMLFAGLGILLGAAFWFLCQLMLSGLFRLSGWMLRLAGRPAGRKPETGRE